MRTRQRAEVNPIAIFASRESCTIALVISKAVFDTYDDPVEMISTL
jgi:hypothetical protein